MTPCSRVQSLGSLLLALWYRSSRLLALALLTLVTKLLTDPQDPSLFNQSKEFLANQYICGQDMLVAPVMFSSAERPGNNRDVYLPQGFFWYHSNLRPWNDQVVALGSPVEGGTVINYTAKITNNYADFSCVTPVYIREGTGNNSQPSLLISGHDRGCFGLELISTGSIIPQLQVRQYVDDYRDGPNHLKFNIYPGKYGVSVQSPVSFYSPVIF